MSNIGFILISQGNVSISGIHFEAPPEIFVIPGVTYYEHYLWSSNTLEVTGEASTKAEPWSRQYKKQHQHLYKKSKRNQV